MQVLRMKNRDRFFVTSNPGRLFRRIAKALKLISCIARSVSKLGKLFTSHVDLVALVLICTGSKNTQNMVLRQNYRGT